MCAGGTCGVAENGGPLRWRMTAHVMRGERMPVRIDIEYDDSAIRRALDRLMRAGSDLSPAIFVSREIPD